MMAHASEQETFSRFWVGDWVEKERQAENFRKHSKIEAACKMFSLLFF